MITYFPSLIALRHRAQERAQLSRQLRASTSICANQGEMSAGSSSTSTRRLDLGTDPGGGAHSRRAVAPAASEAIQQQQPPAAARHAGELLDIGGSGGGGSSGNGSSGNGGSGNGGSGNGGGTGGGNWGGLAPRFWTARLEVWLSSVYIPTLVGHASRRVVVLGALLLSSLVYSLTLLKPTQKDFQWLTFVSRHRLVRSTQPHAPRPCVFPSPFPTLPLTSCPSPSPRSPSSPYLASR